MKRILIAAALFGGIAIIVVAVRFHTRRQTYLADYGARTSVLLRIHECFRKTDPDTARELIEVMILQSNRNQQELLSHLLGPWWPRRLRGSYEYPPIWARPTRQERIAMLEEQRRTFAQECGITNRQQESEIMYRVMKQMMEEPTTP